MPPRMPAALILTILTVGLAGCSLFESRETRLMRQSPDYKSGYADGCATSNSASRTTIRDDAAYRGIRAYSMGWNTGRSMCRASTGSDNPFIPVTR